jgi:hypothetical protein
MLGSQSPQPTPTRPIELIARSVSEPPDLRREAAIVHRRRPWGTDVSWLLA